MIGLLRVLAVIEAATFVLASLLHLGIAVPVLSGLGEPLMPQAGIPEGIIGVVVAIGAAALFVRTPLSWAANIATHLFAIAGVLVGMASLAAGLAVATVPNEIYHRGILVVLLVALAILVLRRDDVLTWARGAA